MTPIESPVVATVLVRYTIFCVKCIWVLGMCPELRCEAHPDHQLTVSQWPDQSDIACYGPDTIPIVISIHRNYIYTWAMAIYNKQNMWLMQFPCLSYCITMVCIILAFLTLYTLPNFHFAFTNCHIINWYFRRESSIHIIDNIIIMLWMSWMVL